ncbi:hypothetical protein [Cellulomonas hominis]
MASTVMDTTTLQAESYTTWDATPVGTGGADGAGGQDLAGGLVDEAASRPAP